MSEVYFIQKTKCLSKVSHEKYSMKVLYVRLCVCVWVWVCVWSSWVQMFSLVLFVRRPNICARIIMVITYWQWYWSTNYNRVCVNRFLHSCICESGIQWYQFTTFIIIEMFIVQINFFLVILENAVALYVGMPWKNGHPYIAMQSDHPRTH